MHFVEHAFGKNLLLKVDGNKHYVSWLPPKTSNSPFPLFAQDGDEGGETAFFDGDNFLILNGDHRKGYEAVYPDLDLCTKYFWDHIDQVSSWSEHENS